MARVDYIKCDICGNVINKDNTLPGGFRFRIHNAIESMSHHRINKLKG